jgi:hypothetical protein
MTSISLCWLFYDMDIGNAIKKSYMYKLPFNKMFSGDKLHRQTYGI